MSKEYTIISRPRLLRDEAGVKRHIENDDYFGTIATILGLIKEQIKKRPDGRTKLLEETLIELEKDLVFLQDKYQIICRPEPSARPLYSQAKIMNRKSRPNGRLTSQ